MEIIRVLSVPKRFSGTEQGATHLVTRPVEFTSASASRVTR